MSKRKNGTNPETTTPLDILKAAAGDADDFNITWDGLRHDTLARLACAVSNAGGLLTLGKSSDGSGLYCSIRFGAEKRAYTIITSEQFDVVADTIIDACKKAVRPMK